MLPWPSGDNCLSTTSLVRWKGPQRTRTTSLGSPQRSALIIGTSHKDTSLQEAWTAVSSSGVGKAGHKGWTGATVKNFGRKSLWECFLQVGPFYLLLWVTLAHPATRSDPKLLGGSPGLPSLWICAGEMRWFVKWKVSPVIPWMHVGFNRITVCATYDWNPRKLNTSQFCHTKSTGEPACSCDVQNRLFPLKSLVPFHFR